MKRISLFLLLIVPGMAFAAICKTIGADGTVTFTNVPGSACPSGSVWIESAPPLGSTEHMRAAETGISGREVANAYRTIRIVSPQNNATVRESSITAVVDLEPALQQSHFVTAYLDGRAYQGRYGSDRVELTGLERGTHRLWAQVSDSKGKVLASSEEISFTVQKIAVDQIIGVDPVTGDDYVDTKDPRRVRITGFFTPPGVTKDLQKEIILNFPLSGVQRKGKILDEGKWEIYVRRDLLANEASFEVTGRVISEPADPPTDEIQTTKRYSVAPQLFKGFTGVPPADYSPAGPADYAPSPGGITTTPGQTNPAFTPNYRP